MKIIAVKAHPVCVALDEPSWTAQEIMRDSSVILVEVQTDEGLVGVGQIHAGPMREVCDWVERLGTVTHGMDPCAHTAVWNRLFSLTCPRPGAMPPRDGVIAPLPRAARPQVMAAIGGMT